MYATATAQTVELMMAMGADRPMDSATMRSARPSVSHQRRK
jgi:hypothetical protein